MEETISEWKNYYKLESIIRTGLEYLYKQSEELVKYAQNIAGFKLIFLDGTTHIVLHFFGVYTCKWQPLNVLANIYENMYCGLLLIHQHDKPISLKCNVPKKKESPKNVLLGYCLLTIMQWTHSWHSSMCD